MRNVTPRTTLQTLVRVAVIVTALVIEWSGVFVLATAALTLAIGAAMVHLGRQLKGVTA